MWWIKVFTLIGCFVLSMVDRAWSISMELEKHINSTMSAVFDDVLQQVKRHPELINFGSQHFNKNSQGLYQIDYEFVATKSSVAGRRYRFGLGVVDIKEPNPFGQGDNVFEHLYPLLGVKFVAYHERYLSSRQLSAKVVMDRHLRDLSLFEQNELPVRLSVETEREIYPIKEDFDLTVKLTNVSEDIVQVFDLNEHSLFIIYDKQSWGDFSKKAAVKKQTVILKPDESIEQTFRFKAPRFAKKFEIFVKYHMNISGVFPWAAKMIEVVR